MKFSALIPYKPNDFYRIKNFDIVTKRWEEKIPDVELIIGVNNDLYFNRSKAVNEAARQATGDYFIIVDGDIVFGTKLIDKIADIVANHPWIIPWSRCYALSKEYSAKFYEDNVFVLPKKLFIKDLQRYDKEIDGPNINGPYMNVMSGEAFAAIGGMDERFVGWGGEDEAMAAALTTLVGKPFRMNEQIIHLYHDHISNVEERPNYKANRALCNSYKSAFGNPAAMNKLINARNIK
jgi:predicted glycosyltransferase involved in capsule biosynthesis